MKVTQLWYYPIKGIQGIQVQSARLGPQGLQHDRRFMLCKIEKSGELAKLQLSGHPECSLFKPEVIGDKIRVKYLTPKEPLLPWKPEQDTVLEIPIEPKLKDLDRADINLYQSHVIAYRMGSDYDAWFTACFGFDTALIYIGDGRRPVLGTFSPKSQYAPPSWTSLLVSHLSGKNIYSAEEDWITFSDCAPYLVVTEESLNNVRARLSTSDVDVTAMRPNIVLDGEVAWDEDFWARLVIGGAHVVALTKNCNRCTSLNVDYETGRTAEGERGTVLKKLMSDRRVDTGMKYSPVFGRYGFLTSKSDDNTSVSIGDNVEVTARQTERAVWDWTTRDSNFARYYQKSSDANANLSIVLSFWLMAAAVLGLLPCWLFLS
ncbi:hypothetical protein FVEN_g4096 [Fusarium venenatum]|uniref:MOSC domain-containing protein n=1 Tax=Fusarium venenatum TaxID=56646 RepID=A0A2L2TLQ8_9HYPO|nr:uncharacterized protein FVRRES_09220 [Fusarium venenatum]KAG8358028.1 hypothetical protein FVEN_g4096 [Fusarium venenatum]CEI69143.1 unnamed protein product [Fusarium venenatum]